MVSTKRWRGWTIAAALSMPACANDEGPRGAEGMADETSAGTTGGASSMGTTGNASADDSAGTTGNASNDDTSSTTTASTSAGTTSTETSDHPPPSGDVSPFIVVDQFGYRPDAAKIAVVRVPREGYDAGADYAPGTRWAVVAVDGNAAVLEGNAEPWSDGAVHEISGDRAWWFDFSSLTAPGEYYVLDVDNAARSAVFTVADDVYREPLRHAVRTFFYQRAGFAKEAPFADAGWVDGASHVGPGQDTESRLYSAPDDASTERDLSGGWYDAGDYNKYTRWSADYVVSMLLAYEEHPAAFGDDFGIPESGNGVPDILDEARWGMDWLVRMQNDDGSVLSIVGLDHASPPSAATGPSRYGSASTTATLATAAAFALGATIYDAAGDSEYAADLERRSVAAWAWAQANPDVLFYNNDDASGTSGLGAGQQETDDYGRLTDAIEAAVFLYERTGEREYADFVADNYGSVHLVEWGYAYPFEIPQQDMLLRFAGLPGVDSAIAATIRDAYADSMATADDNLPAFLDGVDPYLAHLSVDNYTWGSNATKSQAGNALMAFAALESSQADAARTAAEHYLHYLHGVNPLGLVYLSNMGSAGAERSVTQFYHSWFVDGSPDWDEVGVSTHGPAPGFLVGGPNPSYSWDGCCPGGCGSAESNALCGDAVLSPPAGQPPQKAYLDWNDGWPVNSWSVTENSNGYQLAYIRLLSKFVGG